MKCRVCDSVNLELAVDLGKHPWCNHFLTKEEVGSEPFYPLRLMFCFNCTTAQLDYTVKKEIMFGDHTYLSGMTNSLSAHFREIAVEVDHRFCSDKNEKSVLDIGSNDGTQLKHFQDLGFNVLGVEPSKTIAKMAIDTGVDTIEEFFNFEVAQKINRKFNIINAAGVFFHLEELHSVSDGIRFLLADDGVFVVQFLYMKRIMENLAFDQIYHEHLLYYNIHNLEILLNRHGLSIFDAYLADIHGGSMIAFVSHKGKSPPTQRLEDLRQEETRSKANEFETYLEFAKRIQQKKKENLKYLNDAKKQNKKIFGFGAPVKGNTLLNYFQVGTDYLDCLVEINELRRDLISPGMHIPVLMENELEELPDIYYVLAWNFKKEILAKNQKLIDQGVEFYFPVDLK